MKKGAVRKPVNGHQKLTHLGHEELTHPGGPGGSSSWGESGASIDREHGAHARFPLIICDSPSLPGDVVYDPCAGSRTTARACVALGRRNVIVEDERSYLERAALL
jgi:hypothetical protein